MLHIVWIFTHNVVKLYFSQINIFSPFWGAHGDFPWVSNVIRKCHKLFGFLWNYIFCLISSSDKFLSQLDYISTGHLVIQDLYYFLWVSNPKRECQTMFGYLRNYDMVQAYFFFLHNFISPCWLFCYITRNFPLSLHCHWCHKLFGYLRIT